MKRIINNLKRLGILMMCSAFLVTADPTTMTAATTSGNDIEDDAPSVSSTSEFLIVGDCVPTPTGNYGKPVHIILPIYNLGLEAVTNLVITPTVSTKPEEWPFKLDTVGLVQTVDIVPASPVKANAYNHRREVEWDLVVRNDALTGYYKLEFNVSYYRDGSIETANLYSYIYVNGSPESGTLEGSDSEGKSNPRIIVTGFKTDPGDVFAGQVFNLTISVQNTSKSTSVNNIVFTLDAPQEGKDENTTYSAFLPTSGSSTIFVDSIGAQQTKDITIEMTAKADLTQKPYVISLKSEYEDSQHNTYTADADVSIPVKQVAKFDVSSFDVQPAIISVDSESNVMFSIYNTGKTTLYNVQVRFEGDSITGGDVFIGKIDSGGTGNVDSMVTGVQPTADEGIIKAIISYEDESGNVESVEKEFELRVEASTGMEDHMGGMDMDGMMEVENTGPRVWVIILIIVIILLAIAGVVTFLIIMKKKKAKGELEDDLNDLLADVEEESEAPSSDDE